MEDAKKVIAEVKAGTTKCSASRKDEITVMKSIMNDPNFSVDVYGKSEIEKYYPGRELRKVVSNAVSAITKIPHKEANDLVDQYEFNRTDASAMVDMSKEFVNTYLQTGRKLQLGARETSNIELVWKDIPNHYVKVPVRDGDGSRASMFIPAHGGIKAYNPCPDWVPNNENNK